MLLSATWSSSWSLLTLLVVVSPGKASIVTVKEVYSQSYFIITPNPHDPDSNVNDEVVDSLTTQSSHVNPNPGDHLQSIINLQSQSYRYAKFHSPFFPTNVWSVDDINTAYCFASSFESNSTLISIFIC